MSHREYHFELPLNVPAWGGFRRQLIDKIVSAGLWDELPVALIIRLSEAEKNGTGITITKADLDSIPDAVWKRVEAAIG
jgi:hypothetical protein